MKSRLISAFVFAVLLALTGCSGGGSGDDGLKDKDREASSRIDKIAKETGGDWTKVSEDDKKYLVNEVAMGSEQSAKMLLQSKAGALRADPGGKQGQ